MNEQSLYEKNVSYMEKKFPGITGKLGQCAKESAQVGAFTTRDGQTGFFLRRDEGVIQLNSKYNARAYADIWAENVLEREKLSRKHVLLVFGFGNGAYIEALKKRMPRESILICYEPSQEIFMEALQRVDIAAVMPDISAVFVEGINMDAFGVTWRSAVTTMNGSLIHMAALPNYIPCFGQQLPYIMELVKENNERILVNENTHVTFADVQTKNEVALLPHFVKSRDLTKLFEALPKGVPAIVVSAGPSLSKNIKYLKKAKNKALIIAIDTSVKLLLQEGIVPDIYATIDARKPLELFSDERIHEIPVCVTPYAIPEAVEKQKSSIFFSIGTSYIGRIAERLEKPLGFLGDGGTVSQDAFVLAMEAGMSPIILVGQDLAYTDEQTHAEGVTYGSRVSEDAGTLWVEDVYGKPVRTIGNLDMYRRWYEDVIRTALPDGIRVIDATEGGARIAGTEIQCLADVIEKECKQEYDFKRMIESVPPLFTEQEQTALWQELREMPAHIKEIKEMSQRSREIYEEIYEHSEELPLESVQELLKELEELSGSMEERTEYMLVESYVAAVARDALRDLDNESEDLGSELKEIARRGLVMAQALLDAAPKAMEEVHKMLAKL